MYRQRVIYCHRSAVAGVLEEPVKQAVIHSTAALVVAMAVLTVTGCSRPEPAPQAPVDMVTDHRTISVTWEKDLPSALERAQHEGKPVLVNFYADWCVWCKRLESTTLRDAKVASILQERVVPVSLDVDGSGRELSNEFRVDGLPTIIMLDADGHEIGRIPGYMPPDTFLERVEGFLHQG